MFILGELIRKKWKNIRDRFARELQERKGKSGDGARTKAPYVYTKHLQFLKDILTPKQTINSLEQISNTEPIISEQEPGPSMTNPPQTEWKRLGKKRLYPFEDKLINSLETVQKKMMEAKSTPPDDNDDNRHFVLSLQPSLSALPRHLNTLCRIELLQVMSKYETYGHSRQNQLQTIPSFTQSQFSNMQQHHQQQPQVPVPSPSPASSYISTFSTEEDSFPY